MTWLIRRAGAALAGAQAIDSNLVGVVTDSSGAAVPKSQVTAANKDTGVKYSALADGAGQCLVPTGCNSCCRCSGLSCGCSHFSLFISGCEERCHAFGMTN